MSDFWNNKKVLVTGHTGFVGCWLSCVLVMMGANVTGFSLMEEEGSLFSKVKKKLDIQNIYGDLRDLEEISACVNDNDFDIVFHIAAFGFVKECYEDPERAYSCNVMGTLNLLRALESIEHPIRIIIASSDKVYQNNDKGAYLFSEEDPLGGSDPYSASKTCEDITARGQFDSYLKQKGASMCVIRASNILGGGDHVVTRLIPSIFLSISNGQYPQIKNPDSIRPWQHILDVTDAYLTLARTVDKGCRVFNVGPEKGGIKTVGEIAEYVLRLYGMDSLYGKKEERLNKGIEKAYLGLSIDKIKSEIGWKPRKTLDETLDEIYEFNMNDDGINTYALCESQIAKYYEY